MNIQQIRQQFPQYNDLSDDQLASALHQKSYADMPFPEFAKRIGFDPMRAEAKSMGAGQVLATGAGRTVDRLAGGLKQAVVGAGAVMAEAIPKALGGDRARQYLQDELVGLDRDMRERDRLYQSLQQERPVLSAIGETAPLMAAPAMRLMGGPGAGAAIGNAALTAALPAAAEYGTAEERGIRGATGLAGGAVGGGIGLGISRALNPVRAAPTAAQEAAQQAAERLGVKLSTGEQTGSRAVRWAESALGDLPFASGMEQGRQLANTKAMSTAFAKALGQNADEITPQVLAQARNDTGQMFQQLFQGRGVPLDAKFQGEVRGIVGSKVMKELRDEGVDEILDQFRNLPAGKITLKGDWFRQNKTALDQAIRTAYNSGQNGKANALEGLEKALDGALRRSLTGQEKQAFDAANKQWATLRIAETGQVVKDGRVMPAALDSALKNRYGSAYREGKLTGEVPDIAALASTLRPPPNSGTAARGVYSGLAGGAAFVDPMTAATLLGAPALTARALQSEAAKRYLSQGLFPISEQAEQLMIRGGGGLFGLGAPAYLN